MGEIQRNLIRKRITLNFHNKWLVFTFEFDKSIIEDIKTAGNGNTRWNPDDRFWSILVNEKSVNSLKSFMNSEKYSLVFNHGEKEFLHVLNTTKPAVVNNGRYFRFLEKSNSIVLKSEYDPNIVNDIKHFAGKGNYAYLSNDLTWHVRLNLSNISLVLINIIGKYSYQDIDNKIEDLHALLKSWIKERDEREELERKRIEHERRQLLLFEEERKKKRYYYDPKKNLLTLSGNFTNDEIKKIRDSSRGEGYFNERTREYQIRVNEFNGQLLIDNVLTDPNLICETKNYDDLEVHVTKIFEIKKELIDASHKAHAEEFEIPGFNPMFKPFPFQYAGIEYGHKFKKCIIADEQGLGKTLQAIGVIAMDVSYPALIIPPANVKFNWKKEFLKWLTYLNEEDIEVVTGRKYLPPDNEKKIYIINYDLLSQNIDWLLNIKFKSLVLDEAHYIKNNRTKRYKIIHKIVKANTLDLFLPLTGTPILNRIKEFKPLITLLDKWHVFGDESKFNDSYINFDNDKSPINQINDLNKRRDAYLEELNEKLRSSCMIRREKKDVMKDLPDKLFSDIPVEISNREEYIKAEEEMLEWINSGGLKSILDPIQAIKKAFKYSDEKIKSMSEEQINKRFLRLIESKKQSYFRAEHLVRIENLKQLSLKGKKEAIVEWIDNFLESTDKKLVVFGIHQSIIKELADRYKCPAIYGGISAEKRQEYVDQFQNDTDCRLIVLNVIAGGEGITLTASSDLLFIEYYWNPGKMDQASDRVHRIGQFNTVNIYNMYGKFTIDEDIISLIENKRHIVRGATQGVFIDDRKKVTDTEFLINGIKARNKHEAITV
jgi:SWI/SNF-related matrix-associated actin-dependent regulator 1 of chromatin subfamily A